MRSSFNTRTTRFALSASMLVLLAACGGGGGSGSPSASNTTTGVAAIGAPIVGGNVALKCASGATASATTGADGTWGVALKTADYPCAVRVSGGTANGQALASPLHSLAQAAGRTNVTPLTDLIAAIVGGQSPAAWYDNAKSADLSGSITTTGLSTALDKLKVALSTLPGKPALPNGFDPLTSAFNAQKGDAGDDLLESYGGALQAAGLTQADAATHTASGQALTQKAYAATVYSTPNMTAAFGFRGGASTNLDGTTVLSIPDPIRGALTAKVQSVDADGNVTALAAGSSFSGFVSLLGNRVGQLCTAGKGAMSSVQRSLYVYASDELTEVTDPNELKGITFDDYEDCQKNGTFVINANGEGVFTETGGTPDDPDPNILAAFTPQGVEYSDGTAAGPVTVVTRARAYKFTVNGVTKYVIVNVTSRKGRTSPETAEEIGDDTDYVTMDVSQ